MVFCSSVLTSVALSLFDPVKTEYINLGSGLPTEEFYREGMLEKFKSRVKGTHKVKFNHPVFNDAEITLIVKDVAAIPEGSAAMINQLYDSDGAVIEEKSELSRRLTLTVDIGAITTDISAVENNRSVGTMCFGIEKGMYHALDEVIEDIAKDYGGYRLSRHRLMQYLTLEGGKIPYKKQTIDGTAYAKYRYGQLAEDISRKVVNRLNREKPNIQDEVYTTFVVGGGALALSEYLPGYLKDYQLEFSEDPIYANARGYFKVAKSLLEIT
jgi:plasmid segregation protein ParM